MFKTFLDRKFTSKKTNDVDFKNVFIIVQKMNLNPNLITSENVRK